MPAIIDWSNQNSGFLTLVLFVLTLAFGWVSGIFKALMHKPDFKIGLLPVPTFICTYPTEQQFNQENTHRTAAVVYLKITNIGAAPAQITSVRLGYHNHSFKYTFLWYWLNQISSIGDFGHTVGENLRVFPFLFQKSVLLPQTVHTYLQAGQETNGIVYFEQPHSWGSYRPRVKNKKTNVLIRVTDAYGNNYSKSFKIDVVDIDYARKFNCNFGNTLALVDEHPIETWIQ
ncbi:MAG: hypothetical protein HOP04_03535 [Methylophilaceae bacterium]|nr:hypothetical protein [Methylophilaceae bacterium]